MTTAEIRQRLAEIEAVLFARSGYANTHIADGLDAENQLKYGPYLKSLPAWRRPAEHARLVASQNIPRRLQREEHFAALRKEAARASPI